MCLEPDHQKEKERGWGLIHTLILNTTVFVILLTILINIRHA